MKDAFSFIILLFFIGYNSAYTQDIIVGQGGQYPTLSAAEPFIGIGDSVLILDGTYSDGTQFLNNLNGTLQDPITIYAESLQGVIFDGGTEAIHFIDCTNIVLDGFIFQNQTGNGVNIDDGGDYSTPAKHFEIRNCLFRDMAGTGNNDFLKLSGLDSFHIHHCTFLNGNAGGSGIDMVGCHWGLIEDNLIDDAGVTGIQAKGGTQYIEIRRNVLKNMDQRALNLGGSTGFQFFRPPLPNPPVDAFEAADLQVYSNVFENSWAPIAYVGCVRVKVTNNTIYSPDNWVIRILQETVHPGFLPCGDNEFRNNIVVLETNLTEVNVGANTAASTFIFTNNLWFNQSSNNWTPILPVVDSNQIIGDPLLINPALDSFDIASNSIAIGEGIALEEPIIDYDRNFYLDPPSIGAFEGDSSTDAATLEIANLEITLLPNPSFNKFKIEGDFLNKQILLLDAQGMLVEDYSNASSPLIIDTSTLAEGVFLIKVEDQNNNLLLFEQIIKE